MKFVILLILFVAIFIPVRYGLRALWQYLAEKKKR